MQSRQGEAGVRERSRVYDAELHALVGELCYPVDNLAFVVRLEIDDFPRRVFRLPP